MLVAPYRAEDHDRWNAFVDSSKNGTFLFRREYMEYHSDRFPDGSLTVSDDDRLVALLPATVLDGQLSSHAGLTYGGFVVDDTITTPAMVAVFDHVVTWLREHGIRNVVYKTVPHIYHRVPAEEDQYVLFQRKARLTRRDILSVVALGRAPGYQARRRRGVRRAQSKGVEVRESPDFASFWRILAEVLEQRHGVRPVHTLEEIQVLAERFPRNIRLFTAALDGRVLAGTVVYEAQRVAHAQYIATSLEGRELGALDLLFDVLLQSVFAGKPYFDFGISTENGGTVLNVGLVEQKEGFGARAVVHDHYTFDVG